MQPMYTKKANIEIAKKLGTINQFTLDDPSPPKVPVLINTMAGVKYVLDNPQLFPGGWKRVLENVFYDQPRDLSWFMLNGDEPKNYEHRQKMMQAVGKIPNLQQAVQAFVHHVGTNLIEKEDFELKKGLHQIDIVRDVAIPLNTQLMSDLLYFDLRTDENPDGTLGVAELYRSLINIRIYATNNINIAESWNRRRRAAEGAKIVIDSTRKLVDEVRASRGLGIGISAVLSKNLTRQAYHKDGSLRSCGFRLVDELLAQGSSVEHVVDQLWLTAIGATGVLVTVVI